MPPYRPTSMAPRRPSMPSRPSTMPSAAGEPGRARVTAASEISWTVRQRHVDAFPLSGERVAEIFADLGERVAAIYAAEVDALETTARAIGR